MKKKFTDILGNAGREYSLSDSERAKMRRVISEYTHFKPLPRPATTLHFSFSWRYLVHQPLAMALVLVLFLGSGMSYAAETALPGDALYTIKTMVNEPVRVALATNPEAHAEIQIELAERRIEEAVTLAAEGRLESATEQTLVAAFEEHASYAAAEVEAIDSEDAPTATELSSRFETRLAAHAEVIAELSDADEMPTREISNAIQARGIAIASIRTRGENKAAVSAMESPTAKIAPAATMMMFSATVSDTSVTTEDTAEIVPDPSRQGEAEADKRTAERMESAAEKQLKAAQKKLKSAKLQDEARVQAEANLKTAEELIENGREYLEDDSIALAFHAFQESLVISEKLQVKVKAEPALAKARFARTNRTIEAGRAAATATMQVEPASTAIETTTQIETMIMAAPASATPTSSTSSPVKTIPPPLQIFIPLLNDEGEVRGESTIDIDISL
jgi:hypothetical protein